MSESIRTQVIRDFRREQLVDAARALFEERGTVEVSMADIATGAGVSRSTLYNCFGAREEVLEACVVAGHKRLLASTTAAVAAGADPFTRLVGFFEVPIREVDAHPVFFRITQGLLSGSTAAGRGASVEMSLLAMGLSATLLPILEAGIADGSFVIDDLEAARELVFAVLNGALLRRSFGNNRPPPESAVRLARMVVAGLSGRHLHPADRDEMR